MKLVQRLRRIGPIYRLSNYLCLRAGIVRSWRHNSVVNKAYGWVRRDIIGRGNRVEIRRGTTSEGLRIGIRGNNNTVIIEEGCYFGPQCLVWIQGSGNTIRVGAQTTFTSRCELNAQEHDTMITIGRDCMFANRIFVRTSDAHPIINVADGRRTNPPRNVTIGDHVWISPNTKLLKGSEIAAGCIIGSDSTVSGAFTEPDCLIAGRPARVCRPAVTWTRQNLFRSE